MRPSLLCRTFLAGATGLAAVLFCSCSSPAPRHAAVLSPVRAVDCRAAPETRDLADQARALANEFYPKVCALLADGKAEFPRGFDIQFKKRLPNGNTGDAPIHRIRLSAQSAGQFRESPAMFEQVVTHELAHVAQNYYKPIVGRWIAYSHNPPTCWVEGIADYVCFKLGQTNTARCAECELLYPDYRNGYSCAGAFLLYLEQTYNSNLVRELNTRLRDGGYSEAFFASATGKQLPQLWAEFQQTPAFTSDAARMLELRRELGYVNDKPPRDITRRFTALVDQHADRFAKEFFKCASVQGLSKGQMQARMALYLYATQPGGAAEIFMMRLVREKKLPGFGQRDKGTFSAFLRPSDLTSRFPVNRTFTATKVGDASKYHYEVARTSVEDVWRLKRAWRTDPAGQLGEEYPIQ